MGFLYISTLLLDSPCVRERKPTTYQIHKKWREMSIDTGKVTYFRHKVGVNSTKIVKTSNRPSNMAAEHTQVWNSLSTP